MPGNAPLHCQRPAVTGRQRRLSPRPLSKVSLRHCPSKSPSRARLPFPLSRPGSKILLLKRQRKGEGGCRLLVICTVILSDHPPQKPSLLLKPCQRHQAVAAPSRDPQDMENSTLKERKPPQEHIYISEKFPEQPNLQRQKADSGLRENGNWSIGISL